MSGVGSILREVAVQDAARRTARLASAAPLGVRALARRQRRPVRRAKLVAVGDGRRSDASILNRELTDLLVEAGEQLGFSVVTEFVVDGGRIDVVWTWDPGAPIPGLVGSLPVAGFEIESSWRTRKHVKGDLLNLQDAGVALGVIVLAVRTRGTSPCAGSRHHSSTDRAPAC